MSGLLIQSQHIKTMLQPNKERGCLHRAGYQIKKKPGQLTDSEQ